MFFRIYIFEKNVELRATDRKSDSAGFGLFRGFVDVKPA